MKHSTRRVFSTLKRRFPLMISVLSLKELMMREDKSHLPYLWRIDSAFYTPWRDDFNRFGFDAADAERATTVNDSIEMLYILWSVMKYSSADWTCVFVWKNIVAFILTRLMACMAPLTKQMYSLCMTMKWMWISVKKNYNINFILVLLYSCNLSTRKKIHYIYTW